MLNFFKKFLYYTTVIAIFTSSICVAPVFASGENLNYPYIITKAEFNSGGTELTVSVDCTAENTVSGSLIIASYTKDRAIKKISFREVIGDDTFTLDYKKEIDESVRLFLWDNITSAIPLCESVVPSQEGIVQLKGKVIENSITTLYGYKNVDTSSKPKICVNLTDNCETEFSDFAELGKYYFNVCGTDAESYIGLPVVLTAIKNDNEYDLLSISLDLSHDKYTEFTLDNFVSADNESITYLKDNQIESQIKVQDKPTIVYNNITETFSYTDLFEDGLLYKNFPQGGKVTLYDTDATNGCDIIFVEIPSFGIVDKIENNIITFKNDVGSMIYANHVNNIIYEENATDIIINITKDGNKISVSDIKEWDVLSIITNYDLEDVYNIEVLSDDNIIEGAVSEITDSETSGTGCAYTINGTKYDVSLDSYNCDRLNVDDNGIFYINNYGKLVASNISVVNNSTNYAYVLDVSASEDNFGNGNVQFKLLTSDHGIVILDAASKFKIRKSDGVEDIYITKDEFAEIEAFVPVGSTIMYTMGEDTLKTVTFPGYDEYGFNKVYVSSSYEYNAETLTFANRDVDDTTVVMFVNDEDHHKSKVGTIADLKDCKVYENSQLFVDDEDWNVINLLIVKNYETTPSIPLAVISDAVIEQNSNGESIYNLSFMTDGEIKSAKTTASVCSEIANITEGDIYTFIFNNSGEIEKATPYVDLADGIREKFDKSGLAGKPTYTISNNIGDADEILVSSVLNYDSDLKKIYVNEKPYKLRSASNIYVIDPALEGKISLGDFNSISIDETLLNTTSDVSDENGNLLAISSDINGLLDYVIFRTHEDIVEDIVIVKAYDYGKLSFGLNYDILFEDADIAIIKSAEVKKDTNGNNIYSIKYLMNGSVKTSETTAEAYSHIANLTTGDVYKFLFNESNKIEKVRMCVDFADGIKEKYDSNGYAGKIVYSSVTNNTESTEKIIVAPVLYYTQSTKLLTVDNERYKLSHASNVYVIDLSANTIATGSVSDINYDRYLTEAVGDIIDRNNNVIATGSDVTPLTDWVVLREYNDIIEEMVIINNYYYGSLSYETY